MLLGVLRQAKLARGNKYERQHIGEVILRPDLGTLGKSTRLVGRSIRVPVRQSHRPTTIILGGKEGEGMAEEVRIKFFKVNKCGYYRRGSQVPEFGGLADMLSDIGRWVDRKSLSETATYEPSEEQDSNLLRTFCYGIRTTQSGGTLLTTWNELPTTEGAVVSVKLSSQVNAAAVSSTPAKAGFVTGYPSYFWFPHGMDGYATIQVRNRLNGRLNLRHFVRGFLEKYSRHVVVDESESTGDEDVIPGYAMDGDPTALQRVHALYDCSVVRMPGKIDFLRDNRSRIRRIERRDVLTYRTKEELALWQSIWRSLSGKRSADITGQHRLRFDLECQPSAEEFEAIVRRWQQDQDSNGDHGQFQDIGFRLIGDDHTHWLSRSLASDVVELELDYLDAGILDGRKLLNRLDSHRPKLLRLASEGQHAIT